MNDSTGGWNLSWSGVDFSVPNIKKKKEMAHLLSEISGLASAGRITAIMGPSGSGEIFNLTDKIKIFLLLEKVNQHSSMCSQIELIPENPF